MNADRKTQQARILRLLIDARGQWVALPEIMACAAQYNARIFELRRLEFDIENRTQVDTETGARHSWFRLVARPAAETPKPEPLDRAWKNRTRLTGLPLFDAGVRP